MIKSFLHEGIANQFRDNNPSLLQTELIQPCKILLTMLHETIFLEDLKIPGFNLHDLTTQPKRNGILLKENSKITFEWIHGNAWRVDLVHNHQKVELNKEYYVIDEPCMSPAYPGEIITDVVFLKTKMSLSMAAKHIGVSKGILQQIMVGEYAITPEIAMNIGKLCGNGSGLWNRMQQRYDLWHYAQSPQSEIKAILTSE